MAKRLHMTTADYVAIAISPALIMALVGSLVFFLIEVFYAGEYQVRLTYAFAWFVFAAVLIARIAIEMGSERAAIFALPLGGVMFLFLVKFVEHPSPFSHVINLALMGLVWWCAHRLTWDSTVIDDEEDASGEGLMQRVGVDGPEPTGGEKKTTPVPDGTKENELFESPAESANSRAWERVKQLFRARKGPHTPGLWVLYFSLAALPLFGVGQHWIPVGETGRRRYAFMLLLVYVAAALSLLVTTSFLNLRRYLRQRHVEMPLPIAGTWVGVGAVLIVIVMMLAMLIPRPGAEVALSRVPWRAGSPGGLSTSRMSVNRDGGEQQADQQDATSGDKATDRGEGNLQKSGGKPDAKGDTASSKEKSDAEQGKSDSQAADGKKGKKQDSDKNANPSNDSQQKGEKSQGKSSEDGKLDQYRKTGQAKSDKNQSEQAESAGKKKDGKKAESREQSNGVPKPTAPPPAHPLDTIRNLSSSLGGLVGVLKIIFYIIVAIALGILIWKYREQMLRALAEIMRQLRELFGGPTAGEEKSAAAAAAAPPRSFSEFSDPFLSGQHNQLPPEELVRYTFAAFEAWANDRGRPRTPDCTPQEFIGAAVEPETPLYAEARQLVRMYGEVAYASRRVSRETANKLRELWQLMRSTHSVELAAPAQG